jgi:hypothetical protein
MNLSGISVRTLRDLQSNFVRRSHYFHIEPLRLVALWFRTVPCWPLTFDKEGRESQIKMPDVFVIANKSQE